MNKASVVMGILAAALSACTVQEQWVELDETYPGDEYVVWVAQRFAGGQQCVIGDTYKPPDTAALLRANRIAVFDFEEQLHPVCDACFCPAYSGTHFALIKVEDLAKAEALGFKVSEKD